MSYCFNTQRSSVKRKDTASFFATTTFPSSRMFPFFSSTPSIRWRKTVLNANDFAKNRKQQQIIRTRNILQSMFWVAKCCFSNFKRDSVLFLLATWKIVPFYGTGETFNRTFREETRIQTKSAFYDSFHVMFNIEGKVNSLALTLLSIKKI